MTDDDKETETRGRGGGDEPAGRLAEAIARTIRQPLLVLNGDLTVEGANPAFYRLFRTSEGETLGRRVYDLGDGEWDLAALRSLLDEISHNRPQVTDYRLEGMGDRVMMLDASRISRRNGSPPRILLAMSDVTELERARHDLEGRREYAEKIVDAVREPLLVLGWDLRVKSANASFYEIFKVDPARTEGRLVYELGNLQWDIPELRKLLEEILPRDHALDDFEVEHDFEQLGHRTMLLNARRIDHLQLILLAIRDTTEQRKAQHRQAVLVSELQHRVNNILANVRSISMQTRQHSADIEEFTEGFDGRLGALARTQDLLARQPNGDVSFRRIARQELEARGARDGDDYSLDGPALAFPPSAAQAIGLTLHELITNAVKYGALAGPPGRIDISWSIDRADSGDVIIRWRETGLKLEGPPRKKGFGSRIIEQSLPYMLGGSSEIVFHPDGLECVIRLPAPRGRSR